MCLWGGGDIASFMSLLVWKGLYFFLCLIVLWGGGEIAFLYSVCVWFSSYISSFGYIMLNHALALLCLLNASKNKLALVPSIVQIIIVHGYAFDHIV